MRSRRRQGLSLFAAPVRQNNQNSQNEPGMSLGINQIVNRGAEEGACPLKNKDFLTMTAPYCESQVRNRAPFDPRAQGRRHRGCAVGWPRRKGSTSSQEGSSHQAC